MPNIRKATKRDKTRHKRQYGHRGGGRGYLLQLERKNKERKGGK